MNEPRFSSGDNSKRNSEHAQENDPKLENWNKWMVERQKIAAKIETKLGRKNEDLLINAAEDLRDVIEDKTVLDYTKITTHFDKYRGNPAWYKFPPSLNDKCVKSRQTEYFAVKTKPERNIIPKITYVGVPEVIQKEKHVLPRTRNLYTLWQNNEYRKAQMDNLTSKINLIQPHKPIYKDLVIIGQRIEPGIATLQPQPKPPQINEQPSKVSLEVTMVEDQPIPETPKKVKLEGMEINGILINENSSSGIRKIRLFFDYDISKDPIQTQFITILNRKDFVARLYWEPVKKFRLFRDYVDETKNKSGFYFDKNVQLILPYQKLDLPIKFRAEHNGNYNETWEISTKPPIWYDPIHVQVVFQAYAYRGDIQERNTKLLEHIEVKSRDNLIKEMLADLTQAIRYPVKQVQTCQYESRHVFEAGNLHEGAPRFIFDQTIVTELIKFYDKVKRDCDPETWDYCINILADLALKRDITYFRQNKEMKALAFKETLKNSLPIKQEVGPAGKKGKDGDKDDKKSGSKSSKKNDKSDKNKKGKKSEEVLVIEEKPYEYVVETYFFDCQKKLDDIVRKLHKPAVINVDREKHFACFQILCSYFDRMATHLEKLEDELGVKKSVYYPPNSVQDPLILPVRLTYEFFADCWIQKPMLTEPTGDAKPKARILRDIPPEELERVYETYFGRPVPKPPAPTDKTSAKNTKDKGKKSDKKEKNQNDQSKKKGKDKEPTIVRDKSLVIFDPYAEEFVLPTSEEFRQDLELKFEIPDKFTDEYQRNVYSIIYSNLGEAIDGIVDVINSYNCTVSYEVIKEVKNWFPCRDN